MKSLLFSILLVSCSVFGIAQGKYTYKTKIITVGMTIPGSPGYYSRPSTPSKALEPGGAGSNIIFTVYGDKDFYYKYQYNKKTYEIKGFDKNMDVKTNSTRLRNNSKLWGIWSYSDALSIVIDYYNKKGYHLIDREGGMLIFESGAYKQDELAQLENRLNQKIEEKTKAYVDKAKVEINTAILAYLSKVPDEIFTSEFKTQLQSAIMLEVEKKLKAMSDEIKQEIKDEINN